MGVKGLEQFEGTLRGFIQALPQEHVATVQRAVSLQVLDGVVRGTPVDTGRARGNWQTTIGEVASGEVEITDKDGGATIARGAGALAALPDFAVVYVSNNVPYIERLEDGWSQQAPAGMVASTLERVRAQFE